jgi:hypothetical protein
VAADWSAALGDAWRVGPGVPEVAAAVVLVIAVLLSIRLGRRRPIEPEPEEVRITDWLAPVGGSPLVRPVQEIVPAASVEYGATPPGLTETDVVSLPDTEGSWQETGVPEPSEVPDVMVLPDVTAFPGVTVLPGVTALPGMTDLPFDASVDTVVVPDEAESPDPPTDLDLFSDWFSPVLPSPREYSDHADHVDHPG